MTTPLTRRIMAALASLVVVVTSVAGAAQSGLLIYDLSFNRTGPSVNYSFIEDGWLVVDLAAGTFASVFVLEDPNTGLLYYTTSLLTGSSFQVTSDGDGDMYSVLVGTSSSGGQSVSLQLTGAVDKRKKIGGNQNTRLADGLRGFLLASAPDGSGEAGFAGQSRAGASYDGGLTTTVNDAGMASADAVNFLATRLQNLGIPAQASPSPSPSPTPTPVPSPTP